MAIERPYYKRIAAETCSARGVGGGATGEFTIFFADPTIDSIARGVILASVALLWVVLLVRIVGLRSFSKMTSFDFVMTIAMGSLVGSSARVTEWTDFVQATAAMAALFAVQWITAHIRNASQRASDLIQNQPVVLMRDGKIIDSALEQTRVTKANLIAKLREANVLRLEDVRAAILETTGDVSVLHGDELEETLLYGVERKNS